MRRNALSASLLLMSCTFLAGCSGFGTFLGDSLGFHWNPNQPIGDSENMRRVKGQAAELPPLQPETGNVWPGPAAPPPTLQDLERQQNSLGQPGGTAAPAPIGGGPYLPDHHQPVPSGSNQPGIQTPLEGSPPGVPPSSVPGAGPQGTITPTPRGPSVNTRGPAPPAVPNPANKNGSIVVPNGNGTSTVIAPDGSISTIPTPK